MKVRRGVVLDGHQSQPLDHLARYPANLSKEMGVHLVPGPLAGEDVPSTSLSLDEELGCFPGETLQFHGDVHPPSRVQVHLRFLRRIFVLILPTGP